MAPLRSIISSSPTPTNCCALLLPWALNADASNTYGQILAWQELGYRRVSSPSAVRGLNSEILKGAQAHVLNLTHWHQFLKTLIGAGFRSGEMISSQSALLYSYAFYLIGRIRFKVAEHDLQKVISRWFFASSLTGRYTGSPETIMDSDLNRLKAVSDANGFVAALDEIIGNELTNDYWTITLPADLNSSSARNPQLFVIALPRIGSAARPVLPEEDLRADRSCSSDEEEGP